MFVCLFTIFPTTHVIPLHCEEYLFLHGHLKRCVCLNLIWNLGALGHLNMSPPVLWQKWEEAGWMSGNKNKNNNYINKL